MIFFIINSALFELGLKKTDSRLIKSVNYIIFMDFKSNGFFICYAFWGIISFHF